MKLYFKKMLDEKKLFCQAREGDDSARTELIERYLPLVQTIAKRYQHRGESLEDLVQAGSVGLLKAIDRFDASRGTQFSAFAVPNISGEIKRHFRDTTRTIRLPRDIQELGVKIRNRMDQMATQLGRFPSVGELAEAVGVTKEQTVEALNSSTAYKPDSLDRHIGEDEGTLMDQLGQQDSHFVQVEDRTVISNKINQLSKREKEIIGLRFYADLTQGDIASKLGISQMHVSRLLRKLMESLDTEAVAN